MASCGSVGNSKGWTCGAGTGVVGWFVGLVDSLECCVVDRLKGLWISKGKTRVRELYPKKNYPQKNVCSLPVTCRIQYHFLPFSNKKMEAVFQQKDRVIYIIHIIYAEIWG